MMSPAPSDDARVAQLTSLRVQLRTLVYSETRNREVANKAGWLLDQAVAAVRSSTPVRHRPPVRLAVRAGRGRVDRAIARINQWLHDDCEVASAKGPALDLVA